MTRFLHCPTVLVCLLVTFTGLLTVADTCGAQGIPVGPINGLRPVPFPVAPKQKAVDLLRGDWNSKSQIDWNVAATLALLSKTAYEKDDELMGFVAAGMGFKACHSFNEANSAAHVLVSDNVVVISFRGTEFSSLADWKTDAYIQFFPDPTLGNLHTGFHNAYQHVRANVESILRQSAGKTIWVTGHSLGGAMAVICAARVKEQRLGEPRIVTFGQPRVGDKKVARWIDRTFPNSYQRFVNDNDIVARLPYSNRWFPYSDAGRFIHLDRGNLTLLHGGRAESVATSLVVQENKVLSYRLQASSTNNVIQQQSTGRGTAAREVYQAPDAMLPLEESELDQLIMQEQQQANRAPTRFYFPEAAETTLQTVPLYQVPSSSGVVQAGTSWWSFDRITDHFMDGYLKLIRGLRSQ